MGSVSAKVAQRISAGLKKFQPILIAAKARDVNESDTVIIVTDVLHEVFGYQKFVDITSEHMIRSTFCDLAIKLDGRLALLIEVKAIGTDLKDIHVKQATAARRPVARAGNRALRAAKAAPDGVPPPGDVEPEAGAVS